MILGSQRGITTDGRVLPAQLQKAQCLSCGLVQTTGFGLIDPSQMYSEEYSFYSKPGQREFDALSYSEYARWISSECDIDGLKVLEVGCGEGWLLSNLMRMWPEAVFRGIEPSRASVQLALDSGLPVACGFPEIVADQDFDLVYSVNVIEHTPDPINFVSQIVQKLKKGGIICIVCPDGMHVHNELLFVDHLFSFTSDNLVQILGRCGVRTLSRVIAPDRLGRFQMIVGRRMEEQTEPSVQVDESLLDARQKFFAGWARLDSYLLDRLRKCQRVACFGAGETISLLATYAPRSWQAVQALVVDNVSPNIPTSWKGLPLISVDKIDSAGIDGLLLGVRPELQQQLMNRFRSSSFEVFDWSHRIGAM